MKHGWLAYGWALIPLLLSAPSRAQGYDEVRTALDDTATEARRLDKADAGLRHWLTGNATTVGLDDGQVAVIDKLLRGVARIHALECTLVGDATGGSSSARGIYAAMCEERRYTARALTVTEVTTCLTRVLKKTDGDELHATDCLIPLAPLKTDTDFAA